MTRGKTPPTSGTATNPGATRGWVSFVGSGPGDPGLLTVRAADLLKQADVVVTEVPEHATLVRVLLDLPTYDAETEGEATTPAGPELVDGGFGEDGQPLTHAARGKVVVRYAKKGQRVVRLMTGDPFLYASGPEEPPACVKAGLGFEALVEVDRVAQNLGNRCRRPELADEAGGVPGRAAGQLAAIDENDICLVVAGEMIGGRTADDAAADDDNFGCVRKIHGGATGPIPRHLPLR